MITHDDRDHCGNLEEVLMAAPNATVGTNALTVARLGEEWDVPRHRVRTVNPGRTVELVDDATDADQAGYLAGVVMFTRANAPCPRRTSTSTQCSPGTR